ncbi:Oral cancer-overexpressed protein 1 [Glycine soja]
MDDLFDSSLNLEDTHYKEGYDEGYSHGLVTGKEEARQVGLKVGFEVGEELGFYRGCVDIWTTAIQLDPTCFSPRATKIIGQLEELIQKYPLMDPENVQVQEIMDSLRLKFKMRVAICSSKGVKANKMQHRNLTSGRPSGTDGSDYSYRMVVDSRYQLVAKGKKRLSLYFITEAVLLLIGVTLTYLPGIEADAPNTVAYSSVIVSVVSLIIGNIGRRRSRSGLLRFYAAVSSIAMLLLIASLAQQHLLLKAIQDSKLWKTGKYDVNELSHFQIGKFFFSNSKFVVLGLLLYMVTLSVLKLCTVNAVVSLLFNMAPPKKTS